MVQEKMCIYNKEKRHDKVNIGKYFLKWWVAKGIKEVWVIVL